ncbi:OX-2 membrane glycoprotein-like [Megalops cyprinoides]|uniref:OX-2 membrane glycoprotein-like n=1 Tax=Megalops cyprinoides TaxID=118141 RepID=UPI001863E8B3|nr:OX-2 membrane glycoprotein-like [Megalops cyprinoides]
MVATLRGVSGKVTAPSSVQAQLNLPFTLGCNLTTRRGDVLKQVRWLDGQNTTLLTYVPGQPATIGDHRVEQATMRRHTTAITIKRVGPKDEGCYRCTFDIQPGGMQEGRTCLTVTATVSAEGNRTARSGTLVTLSCRYGLPQKVLQVLWRKVSGRGQAGDVASYGQRGDPVIEEPLRGRVALSHTLGESRLHIWGARPDDEGCYTCEFHSLSEGSKSAVACLTIYVLPRPQMSYRTTAQGAIEANCTALARPPAEIVWNVEGDNRTLGPPVTTSVAQEDGTTLVVSTLTVQAALLRDKSVKCLVHHRGLESPISISMNTKLVTALAILISVTSGATLLLVSMCICLFKCVLRKDS